MGTKILVGQQKSTGGLTSKKNINTNNNHNPAELIRQERERSWTTTVTTHSTHSSGSSSGVVTTSPFDFENLLDVDEMERDLDAIVANWPPNRPSIKQSVRKKKEGRRVTIIGDVQEKEEPPQEELEVIDADNDDEDEEDKVAELAYIEENVLGKDTCFQGPYGEKQGRNLLRK